MVGGHRISRLLFVLVMIAVGLTCSGVLAQNVEQIGLITDVASTSSLRISDNYLYRVTGDGWRFEIFQATDLLDLTLLSSNMFGFIISDYEIANGFGYFRRGSDTIQIIDLTNPVTPVTVGFYIPDMQVVDIAANGSFLYMARASRDSLYAVDVSNPASPFIAGRYASEASIYDFLVNNNHAFLRTSQGIEILDISNPVSITKMSNIIGSSYRLKVNNNYLYNCHDWHYLDVYDISDFSNPTKLSGFSTDSNMAIIQINNTGSLALIYSDYKYGVIDITAPDNPLILGFLPRAYYFDAVLRNDTLITSYYGFYVYHITGQEIGGITGVVRDSLSDLPLQGVKVTVQPNGLVDTTNEDGQYLFGRLYDLTYRITIDHQDYYKRNHPTLTVIGSDTIEYDTRLLRKPHKDMRAYQVTSPPQYSDTGFVYYPTVTIRNEGTETADSVLAVLQVYANGTGIPFFEDSLNVLAVPRESDQSITFNRPLSFNEISLYDLKLCLIYAGDEHHINDTLKAVIDTRPAIEVWYGNLDGSPIDAAVGERVYIDVYAKTRSDVDVGFLHLPLGVQTQYVDSFLNCTEGTIEYPLTEWVDHSFLETIESSPPNLPGWSSQSFLGFYNLKKSLWPPPCYPNCYLHSTTPVKILTFVIKTAPDSTIAGDTIACIGPGVSSTLGPASAGDTANEFGYKVTQYFSPMKFRLPYGTCDYVPGDMSGDGAVMPGDVTYGVRYFKGIGNSPIDSCWDSNLHQWLYPAGDVNGDCEFRASDISYLVAYFKAINPAIQHCAHTPPR
jgi:hypothetical protein